MHHITHPCTIAIFFFIVCRKRRARGKMFKLTRINSIRLLLSILVIVILPSTSMSTILLDPLSPGEFFNLLASSCYWLREMCAINLEIHRIDWNDCCFMCTIFMHRFMTQLGKIFGDECSWCVAALAMWMEKVYRCLTWEYL